MKLDFRRFERTRPVNVCDLDEYPLVQCVVGLRRLQPWVEGDNNFAFTWDLAVPEVVPVFLMHIMIRVDAGFRPIADYFVFWPGSGVESGNRVDLWCPLGVVCWEDITDGLANGVDLLNEVFSIGVAIGCTIREPALGLVGNAVKLWVEKV